MRHRLAVHFDPADALWMDIRMQLQEHGFDQHDNTGNLDAAARTARARADKHQQHENGAAGLRPQVEVRGGKARRCDDRGNLKGGLRERIERASRHAADIEEDDRNRGDDNEHVIPHLFHVKRFFELAEQQEVIGVKIDAEQRHKDGHNPLEIRGIAHEAVVFDAEAARAGSAEGGGNGIKQRHIPDEQQDNFRNRHAEIDEVQDARRGAHFGYQLADRRTGAFCAHQVDVGTAAERNDCH